MIVCKDAYVGDVGKSIVSQTGIDLTGATTTEICLSRPDGSVLTLTAIPVTPITKGDMAYVTIITDLNTAGTYKTQPHVVTAAGADLHGCIDTFEVGEALC